VVIEFPGRELLVDGVEHGVETSGGEVVLVRPVAARRRHPCTEDELDGDDVARTMTTMTMSTRHWITVSRRPSPVIGPSPKSSLQSFSQSFPWRFFEQSSLCRPLDNSGSGRPVIGPAVASLSVLKSGTSGRYVTGTMLAIPRQVSMVDGFRLTMKMTSTFLTVKLRRRLTFRFVLSAGRTDQVDVIERGHRSSVAVDDDLLDKTVRRPRLARRLLSHVTLCRHLEPRPDVGQLGAVCACAGSVEQLRRQL